MLLLPAALRSCFSSSFPDRALAAAASHLSVKGSRSSLGHVSSCLQCRRELSSASSTRAGRPYADKTPRSLREVKERSEIEIGLKGRLSEVVPPRRCREVTTRIGSKFGGSHSLRWIDPPKKILIVKKAGDDQTLQALRRVIRHVRQTYPDVSIVVEREAMDELQPTDQDNLMVLSEDGIHQDLQAVDMVITLGGDGTVLHVASLFARGSVPPVLGVSMGTLGFLMPYNLEEFESALAEVMQDRASLLLRMRLQCAIHDKDGNVIEKFDEAGSQALNEIALHRGRHPHLTLIETYVDGQHLTEAIADGLIISTPTGSTAYSLSAGGPIVHPSVPSLLITPICPRSLSFRSVLLPSDVCIQLRISPKSRAPADLSLDGRSVRLLQPSEYLSVSMSRYPVPCIVPATRHRSDNMPPSMLAPPVSRAGDKPGSAAEEKDEVLDGGWVNDINKMLSFNKAFVTKGTMAHADDG